MYKVRTIVAFICLVPILFSFNYPANAAPLFSVSASEIIATVNALRASQGLAPYKTDGGLMSYAQEHAEYMARSGNVTHTHSDGSSPGSRGVTENIASGSANSMTASFVVYTIWSDALHTQTMVGYNGGSVGVGVAENGNNVYISLDVSPSGGAAGSSGAGGSGSSKKAATTPISLIAAVVTSTPRPDGSIVHVVGYGQSLWQIAITYGVHINDILALNGLPAGSTDIYEGQKLIIFPAGSVTVQPTSMPTQLTPAETATPRPTATRRPPTATRPAQTVSSGATRSIPSPTPDTGNSFLSNIDLSNFHLEARTFVIGGVFLAAGILFIVFLLSFRK